MQIVGIGRLTNDIEVGYSESGTCYARWRMASNKKTKDKDGNYGANFVSCTLFGKRAEFLGNSGVGKGHRLYIVGDLDINDWTDKDGNKRTSVGIIISDFEFVETKKEADAINSKQASQGNSQGGGYNPQTSSMEEFGGGVPFMDVPDIPF